MVLRANLNDSRGRPVGLGRPLGREGGEGRVYEVAGKTDLVAKIYRGTPTGDKAEKLALMVRMASDGLRVACAWPTDLLYSDRGGALVGIVMPRVQGSEIHSLYNPRDRYVEFPKAKWDYLVWTARNIAAAFHTLHSHGVVMGDVNEGNVLVQHNGIVRLIDCDSYQIVADGKCYLCPVGIGLWTPPELQGISLQHTPRTMNHDLFGLAQIIFLLLFMGRHPFAGITSGTEDYDLEEAIRRYLFAYDPRDQRIQPPQVCLRIDCLPADFTTLFQKAFTKGSELANARPTADQWCCALDRLGKNLRTCPVDSGHTYAVHLPTCPWCEIRDRHGLNFFWTAGAVLLPTYAPQDLQGLISVIRGFRPIPRVYKKPAEIGHAKMAPAPVTVPRTNRIFLWGWLILAVCIAVTALGQPVAVLGIFIAIGMISSGAEHPARACERSSRRVTLNRVTAQLTEMEKTLPMEFERYDRDFQKKQQELLAIADRLQNWIREEARIRAETEARKRELQLAVFLDRQLISQAAIPSIGEKRKAKLAAYGVETAFDVNKTIMRMPGFGQSLYESLRKWRVSCERRFKFDPRQPLSPEVVRDMENRIAQTRRTLESEVCSGPEQLKRLNAAMEMKVNQYHSQLSTLVRNKAQAEADLHAVA